MMLKLYDAQKVRMPVDMACERADMAGYLRDACASVLLKGEEVPKPGNPGTSDHHQDNYQGTNIALIFRTASLPIRRCPTRKFA